MKQPPPRGMLSAIGLAVLMHLLLFAIGRPPNGPVSSMAQVPPSTHYFAPASEKGVGDVDAVRVVKSPVVFALPTVVGFSSDLAKHDVPSLKTFTPLPVRSEHFLALAPVVSDPNSRLNPEHLMILAAGREPGLPDYPSDPDKPYSVAKRVLLASELRGRLLGGIVLPPDLNKPVETPWEVRASLSISELGVVEHVFLDQPLKPSSLNQQVLRVLYGLRFKPGVALQSSIEIFSPEAGNGKGGEG